MSKISSPYEVISGFEQALYSESADPQVGRTINVYL